MPVCSTLQAARCDKIDCDKSGCDIKFGKQLRRPAFPVPGWPLRRSPSLNPLTQANPAKEVQSCLERQQSHSRQHHSRSGLPRSHRPWPTTLPALRTPLLRDVRARSSNLRRCRATRARNTRHATQSVSRLIAVSRGTKAPASVGAPFLLHDGTKRFRNLGDVGGDAPRIIGEDSYALCPFLTASLRVLRDVESAQAALATIEDFWSGSGIARYQGRVRRMVTIRPRIFFRGD